MTGTRETIASSANPDARVVRAPVARVTSSRVLAGLALGASAVPIAMVLFVHFWDGVRFSALTRDPNAVSRLPLYVGFLSQMGLVFWSATVAVCFFTLAVISRRPGHQELKRFLLVSGGWTLFLAFDDAFQGHDGILPYFGIPQAVVLGVYAGLFGLYLVRFRRIILEWDRALLMMALGFFGVSLALDRLEPPGLDRYLFEDSAKFIGIVSWLAYFVQVGERSIGLAGQQDGRT